MNWKLALIAITLNLGATAQVDSAKSLEPASAWGQTNLIPNPALESLDAEVLTAQTSDSSKMSTPPTYLEVGGYHIRFPAGIFRGFLLGASWPGKKMRWTNELYMCANSNSDFFVTNVSENFSHLSYGKAFNLQNRSLFFKLSANAGFYYQDLNTVLGYQYSYGLAANPRIQAGLQTGRLRFSLMANGNIGLGWFIYTQPDGTNPNKGKYKFPLTGAQYMAFSLNIAFSL